MIGNMDGNMDGMTVSMCAREWGGRTRNSYMHVYVVHPLSLSMLYTRYLCLLSDVPQKPPVELVYVSGRASPKSAQKSSGMLCFVHFLFSFIFRSCFVV